MVSSKQTNARIFISANTGNGFYSLYDDWFRNENFERIYVIHGGPGTGKSTLMRKICACAKSKGALCKEILCSSDPASLDGIILEKNGKRIGVLDGTAPHPRIFSHPGVKEVLWNLGAFWNEECLCEHRAAIEERSNAKKEAYKHAYALLHAADSCHNALKDLTAMQFDTEKLTAHIERKTKKLSCKGTAKFCFVRAYSMSGEATELPQLSHIREVVLLCGKKHAAEIYLSNFENALRKNDIAHTVYISPLSKHEIDAIYVEECDRLVIWNGFADASVHGKKIHMNRFFKGKTNSIPQRQQKSAEKLEDALIKTALGALEEAGKHHFALEEIYKSAMRFDELRAASEDFCAQATKDF